MYSRLDGLLKVGGLDITMPFSRHRELWLLLCAFLIITLGYWVVWQAYRPAWQILYQNAELKIFLSPLLVLIAWIILSLALSARRCRETIALPIVALLCGVGFLFILRLAGGTFTYISTTTGQYLFNLYNKQLVSFFIGWVMLLVMILGWKNYQSLARYKYVIAFTAITLLFTYYYPGYIYKWANCGIAPWSCYLSTT